MEYTLIKDLDKKSLSSYLDNRVYGSGLIFPSLFPMKTIMSLDFQTLIGTKGLPVAADVVTYDASSPIKTRRTISKIAGDIPPTRIKRVMKETDLNAYNIAKAMAKDSNDSAIMDIIFDDVDACVNGALARLEWLALQAASQGFITLTKSNNAGVVTAEIVDFGMQASHKRVIKSATATRVWNNATATNPKPLTDIRVISDLANTEGINLKYCMMTKAKFREMMVTTEVIQSSLNSTTAGRYPTLQEVNEYLEGQMLPTIILADSYVAIEDEDHTITNVNCWVNKYVTFVPELELGNMLSGPIAAETNSPKQALMSKKDKILVMKYSTADPVNEMTVGLVNAFPSWPTVDRCYRLDTEGTPQADGLDD